MTAAPGTITHTASRHCHLTTPQRVALHESPLFPPPPFLLRLLWESIPQADRQYKQHFAPAPTASSDWKLTCLAPAEWSAAPPARRRASQKSDPPRKYRIAWARPPI